MPKPCEWCVWLSSLKFFSRYVTFSKETKTRHRLFLASLFPSNQFSFHTLLQKFIRNINFYFPTNASLLSQNTKTKLVLSLKRTSLKVFLSFITPPTPPKHTHSLLSGWAAWHNILIWDPQALSVTTSVKSDGTLYISFSISHICHLWWCKPTKPSVLYNFLL